MKMIDNFFLMTNKQIILKSYIQYANFFKGYNMRFRCVNISFRPNRDLMHGKMEGH